MQSGKRRRETVGRKRLPSEQIIGKKGLLKLYLSSGYQAVASSATTNGMATVRSARRSMGSADLLGQTPIAHGGQWPERRFAESGRLRLRGAACAKRRHPGCVQCGRKVPERGPLPHGSTHVGRHLFGLCN